MTLQDIISLLIILVLISGILSFIFQIMSQCKTNKRHKKIWEDFDNHYKEIKERDIWKDSISVKNGGNNES